MSIWMRKCTFRRVHPAYTQIRLMILFAVHLKKPHQGCAGWSESSLGTYSHFDVHFIINYIIMKTCLYSFDPLKPNFYRVKLGFTGVYIIFLISAQKHRLCVCIRTASPRWFQLVPTMFWAKILKKIRVFLSENFQLFWAGIWRISEFLSDFFFFFFFLVVKFSVNLKSHVFIMLC